MSYGIRTRRSSREGWSPMPQNERRMNMPPGGQSTPRQKPYYRRNNQTPRNNQSPGNHQQSPKNVGSPATINNESPKVAPPPPIIGENTKPETETKEVKTETTTIVEESPKEEEMATESSKIDEPEDTANASIVSNIDSEETEKMDCDEPQTEDPPSDKPKFVRPKLTNKQKRDKRNRMLKHILKPRNATSIVDQLLNRPNYEVSEKDPTTDQFTAKVTFDGIEHIGIGRNKLSAKNDVAEKILQYIFNKGPVHEEGETQELPWQQLASFALHKLIESWKKVVPIQKVRQAASKLPEQPHLVHPVMLLNQSCPANQFIELERTGKPPNMEFHIKVVVKEQEFHGKGKNLKEAKKKAAMVACQQLLNVQYPEETVETTPTTA